MKTKRGKSAGVVLTSRHNLQIIEEKERKKQMEAQLKEERKRLREDKKKNVENVRKGRVSQKQMRLTLFCFRVLTVRSTAL